MLDTGRPRRPPDEAWAWSETAPPTSRAAEGGAHRWTWEVEVPADGVAEIENVAAFSMDADPAAAWAALAVLLLYGVVRNIRVWPFSWLAPG